MRCALFRPADVRSLARMSQAISRRSTPTARQRGMESMVILRMAPLLIHGRSVGSYGALPCAPLYRALCGHSLVYINLLGLTGLACLVCSTQLAMTWLSFISLNCDFYLSSPPHPHLLSNSALYTPQSPLLRPGVINGRYPRSLSLWLCNDHLALTARSLALQ